MSPAISPNVDWAAVCTCGWAASSEGTAAGRTRIEQLGASHARVCDDTVRLERRPDDAQPVVVMDLGVASHG